MSGLPRPAVLDYRAMISPSLPSIATRKMPGGAGCARLPGPNLWLLLVLFCLAACSPGQRPAEPNHPPAWRWERLETGLPRQVLVPAVAVDPTGGAIYAGLYQPASLVVLAPEDPAGWRALEAPFAGAPVFHLSFDPSGRLLAATGAGLFERGDGSWRKVDPAPPAEHTAVFAAAAAPGHLFAATDGPGLQRRDGGGQWTTVLSQTVLSLALGSSPASETIVYAGSAGQGIFASRDGGRSWLPPAFPEAFVPEVAADPNNPAVAIASLRDRLVLTRDGGQTWRQLSLDWTAQEVVSLLWTPDNRLYAGTGRGNLYLSRDDGQSWTLLAQSVPAQGGLLALAEGDGQLVAGAWIGVYASSDGGQTWRYLSPALGQPNAFTFLPTGAGLLLGAQTGLFRLPAEDGATAWQPLHTRFPGGVSALAQTNDGRLLAGTGLGVFRSADNGRTWEPAPDPHIRIRQLLAVDECVYAVAAFERVYRSCDGGQSWAARWSGLGVLTEVKTLAVAPPPAGSTGPTLLAGTDHGLFRSRNRGDEWQQPGLSLSDQTVLAILPRPDGAILAGGTRGLFRSTDGGQTFQAAGLPEVTVTALLVHPARPEVIVAGTAFQGLYLSEDGGQTWQTVGPPEMREMQIQAIAWRGEKLLVAGPDGVWQGVKDEG
ncbi:MAG: WD40/YVTN/BNR-like repeat-containing protein, partial [Anaerolineae bacterium]